MTAFINLGFLEPNSRAITQMRIAVRNLEWRPHPNNVEQLMLQEGRAWLKRVDGASEQSKGETR